MGDDLDWDANVAEEVITINTTDVATTTGLVTITDLRAGVNNDNVIEAPFIITPSGTCMFLWAQPNCGRPCLLTCSWCDGIITCIRLVCLISSRWPLAHVRQDPVANGLFPFCSKDDALKLLRSVNYRQKKNRTFGGQNATPDSAVAILGMKLLSIQYVQLLALRALILWPRLLQSVGLSVRFLIYGPIRLRPSSPQKSTTYA